MNEKRGIIDALVGAPQPARIKVGCGALCAITFFVSATESLAEYRQGEHRRLVWSHNQEHDHREPMPTEQVGQLQVAAASTGVASVSPAGGVPPYLYVSMG